MRHPVAGALLLTASIAGAGEIHRADVGRSGEDYYVVLDAIVNAPRASVHRIMTDFDHLDRLSKNIVSSQRVSSENGELVIRIESKSCVWWFCRSTVRTERIDQLSNGDVIATLLPARSDFRSGHYLWHFESIDPKTTRIQLFMTLQPDFWVPPLIGPRLVQKALLADVLHVVQQVEALAASASND